MTSLISGKLDATEASQLTGLSANTLRVYAKKGKIRHLKIGVRFFFDRADLLSLIQVVEPHTNDTTDFLQQ